MSAETPPPLAIDGGSPVRAAPWPDPPPLTPSTSSHPVDDLERAYAALIGLPAGHVIACDSHEHALSLALDAVAGGEGEVVVPALAPPGLLEAAIAAGLTPVPAEADAETGAVSTRGLARAIGPETRAVIVRHPFGHPAPVAELEAILARAGAPMLEEASEALGAAERGRPVGSLGRVAVFGFGPPHLLDAPGGAVLAVPDAGLAESMRAAVGSDVIRESDARLALARLERAEELLTLRRRLAWELTFAVRRMRGVAGMPHGRFVRHAYDRYVVRLRGLLWRRSLEETVTALRAEGIPCEAAQAPSLHRDARVRALLGDDPRLHDDAFPVASRLPGELLALPLQAAMTQREVDEIAGALRRLEDAGA